MLGAPCASWREAVTWHDCGSSQVGRGELLWDRWTGHAIEQPEREAIVHWRAGEPPFRWTWDALLRAARLAADHLAASGVRKGDVCALIIRHHRNFYPVYLGISAIGAIPAVLAYPNPRLHPEKFTQGLVGMAERSGLEWLLTERELESVLYPLVKRSTSSIRGLLFPLEMPCGTDADSCPVQEIALGAGVGDASDSCLLQHSSGTTGLQKAVVLTHQAVLDHVHCYGKAILLTKEDKIVSWLPLYHDMGMIAAFHLALAYGIPTVQIDPFEWVVAPQLLFQVISQEQGTLTWLPNFAYNFLTARVREDELEGVSLDTVRMFINCSEAVRAESHENFFKRFHAYGVKREALAACYAMAETTFAATQTESGMEARTLCADRDALGRGLVVVGDASTSRRLCVSSGKPISACVLRVVDEQGQDVALGHVGELAIWSRSMFDGYRNNLEDTKKVLRDGWYYSGDLGFEWEGEYYVIGRKKDIIIVAGKNIYPEDIEDAVGQVPGVIPGRVIAFGADDPEEGTERICVIAESEIAHLMELNALRGAIVRAGMAIDVTISQVFIAPPRWLIKSSSGKPSRGANKKRVLSGELSAPGWGKHDFGTAEAHASERA